MGIDCLTIQNGDLASLNNTSSDILNVEQIHENCDASIDVDVQECTLSSSSNGSRSTDICAEIVGLTLISKFSKKHLPKMSELTWLMSDDIKPSSLNSGYRHLNGKNSSITAKEEITLDPQPEETSALSVTATRGTLNWAPPRRQIIFTVHPRPMYADE